MLDQLLASFRQILQLWQQNSSNIPEDFTQWGMPNITKSDITLYLETQIQQLEIIISKGPTLSGFLKRQITNQQNVLTNVVNWLQQFSSNPQNMTQNVVNHLESVRNTLNAYGVGDLISAKGFIEEELVRLNQLQKQLAETQASIDQALSSKNQFDVLQQSAARVRQQLDQDLARLETHRTDIQNCVSEVSNSKAEVDRLKVEAQKGIGIFNESLGSLENIKAELLEKRKAFAEAETVAQEQTKRIEETLAAANRVGLANAFTEQRDSLKRPLLLWGGSFIGAIFLLVILGLVIIKPTLSNFVGRERLLNLLLDLPLTGPAIWLAWFSAVRYTYTERLRQDYAYKAAVALALEGFKTQAEKASPELVIELIGTATRVFGQNPLRIYSKRIDDISPLSQLLGSEVAKKVTDVLTKDAVKKSDSPTA